MSEDAEFHFVIDTPKRLSMKRIGEYMVQFGKLLGVPAHLVRVEQTDNAEWPGVHRARTKERSVPEMTPNDDQISAKDASLP